MIQKVLLVSLIFLVLSCSSSKQITEKNEIVKIPLVQKKALKTPKRVPFEKILTAKKDNNGDLIGIANRYLFEESPYKSWFDSRYKEYNTDKQVISEISKNIHQLTIKVFMGTWCHDSQREIPRFYKILDETKFDLDYLQIIAVDRSKKHKNLEQGLNIFRVPTIIFYKNGNEIGRFVEHPVESIEKDILKIVSDQPYKHSYVDY